MANPLRSIRRVIHRVPADPAERSQRLRDELTERVEAGSHDWATVRTRARAAHERLKAGKLPDEGDPVDTVIHTTCTEYYAKGYEIEDLRRGVDGLQARAAAKCRTQSS